MLTKLTTYFKKINPEIKYIFLLFFVTRVVLTIIGVVSRIILEPFHGSKYVWLYSKHLWLDIWGVWDTGHYINIATNGYSTNLDAGAATLGQANYAFFPLYPLLMKALGGVIGNYYIAGIIISNVFLIVACIFLYKLVQLISDNNTALKSIKYLFLFPTAFILSGVFSESLFLALIIMCFYYAKKEKWLIVGILGFLSVLTRSVGILIILPLLYEYLRTKNFKFRNIKIDITSLLLIPAGLFVFSVYNYFLTGDFLAFIHIQQTGWAHILSNPFKILLGTLFTNDIFHSVNGILTIISVLILSVYYKKIGFSYWLLAILLIFFPLTSGAVSLNSMLRYLVVIFPLFVLFAKLSQKRYLDQIITIFLALLQGFLMVFWSNGFNLVV